jgi:hypothetical protein
VSRNGNGDVADLTLRLLRELRAAMATKDDVARIEGRLDKVEGRLAKVEGRLDKLQSGIDARFDTLTRVVKENHRVFARRVRPLEMRGGGARSR